MVINEQYNPSPPDQHGDVWPSTRPQAALAANARHHGGGGGVIEIDPLVVRQGSRRARQAQIGPQREAGGARSEVPWVFDGGALIWGERDEECEPSSRARRGRRSATHAPIAGKDSCCWQGRGDRREEAPRRGLGALTLELKASAAREYAIILQRRQCADQRRVDDNDAAAFEQP